LLIEFTDTTNAFVFSYREWNLDNGFNVAPNPTVGTIYQEPGVYTVSLEVGTTFGCVSSIERDLVIEGPVADFELSTNEICLYDSVTMQITDSVDVAFFSWEFGNGQDSAMVNPLTYYYDIIPQNGSTNIQLVTWSADSACSAAAEIPFQVNLTLAGFDRNNEIAFEDTVHCFGLQDELTNTSVGATDYIWDLGNGLVSTDENTSVTYQSGGFYDITLVASNETTGCLDSIIKPIQVFPKMNVSAEDGLTCEGDTLYLSAFGGESYLWQPGGALNDSLSQFPYLTAQENTELIVLITDTNDCSKSVELSAEYIRPANTPLWSDTVVNFGSTVHFDYPLQPYHSHNWFGPNLNGCSTCSFGFLTPNSDITFGLSVTDELSCFVDTFYFQFTVLDELLFWMPNSFTPNSDGVNDYFFPEITRAKSDGYQFMIFNRNGQLIWETNDINEKWNGAFEESSFYGSTQMYVWKVRVQNLRSEFQEFSGHVTLLR
jgi:gliding motility-associated-like protein